MTAPYEVGELLVRMYTDATTIRYRVRQIVAVKKLSHGIYRYDIKHPNGTIEKDCNMWDLANFTEYHNRLQRKLVSAYKSVDKLERKVVAADRLEKEAKEIFKA